MIVLHSLPLKKKKGKGKKRHSVNGLKEQKGKLSAGT